MSGTRDACSERLQRSEFHAGDVWGDIDDDIARDGYRRGVRLRGIGDAGGRYLNVRRGWQISGSGVCPSSGNNAQGSAATRYSVHAPADPGVRCVGYGRAERLRVAQQNRAAWRRDRDLNLRGGRWRRGERAAALRTSGQNCRHAERGKHTHEFQVPPWRRRRRRGCSKIYLRQRPHAWLKCRRRASETGRLRSEESDRQKFK